MFEGEDNLILPYANIQMRISLKDMQICIFEVTHPEIKVPFVDNDKIIKSFESLRTYSFLFGAENLNEDRGALCVYNGYDGTSKARIVRFRNNLLANFVNTANKIRKRENYNLIYFGARNEG